MSKSDTTRKRGPAGALRADDAAAAVKPRHRSSLTDRRIKRRKTYDAAASGRDATLIDTESVDPVPCAAAQAEAPSAVKANGCHVDAHVSPATLLPHPSSAPSSNDHGKSEPVSFESVARSWRALVIDEPSGGRGDRRSGGAAADDGARVRRRYDRFMVGDEHFSPDFDMRRILGGVERVHLMLACSTDAPTRSPAVETSLVRMAHGAWLSAAFVERTASAGTSLRRRLCHTLARIYGSFWSHLSRCDATRMPTLLALLGSPPTPVEVLRCLKRHMGLGRHTYDRVKALAVDDPVLASGTVAMLFVRLSGPLASNPMQPLGSIIGIAPRPLPSASSSTQSATGRDAHGAAIEVIDLDRLEITSTDMEHLEREAAAKDGVWMDARAEADKEAQVFVHAVHSAPQQSTTATAPTFLAATVSMTDAATDITTDSSTNRTMSSAAAPARTMASLPVDATRAMPLFGVPTSAAQTIGVASTRSDSVLPLSSLSSTASTVLIDRGRSLMTAPLPARPDARVPPTAAPPVATMMTAGPGALHADRTQFVVLVGAADVLRGAPPTEPSFGTHTGFGGDASECAGLGANLRGDTRFMLAAMPPWTGSTGGKGTNSTGWRWVAWCVWDGRTQKAWQGGDPTGLHIADKAIGAQAGGFARWARAVAADTRTALPADMLLSAAPTECPNARELLEQSAFFLVRLFADQATVLWFHDVLKRAQPRWAAITGRQASALASFVPGTLAPASTAPLFSPPFSL